MAATMRAEGAIKGGRLNRPEFVLRVFTEVVSYASEDYTVTVKDGKVTIIKEYEEAFGYNQAAVRFIERILSKPEGASLATLRCERRRSEG
jgi:hypothetical protein